MQLEREGKSRRRICPIGELDFAEEKIGQRWAGVKEFWDEKLPSRLCQPASGGKKGLERMLKLAAIPA